MAGVIGLSGLAIACDDDRSVRAYQTPKEEPHAAMALAAPMDSPSRGGAAQGGSDIHWTLPPGWKELPAQNMEFARFAVAADAPQTALTVVPLGGMAGGLLPNVQRWEGQLKLPASTEADLPKLLTRIDVAGSPVDVVDLSQAAGSSGDAPPQRILAAILPHGDRTWFFKLMGPADVVAAQKPHFDEFVQSLRFGGPAASPAPAPAPPPAAAAEGPQPRQQAQQDSGLKAWKTPEGWTEVPSTTPFRVVSFKIPSQGAAAAEAVISKLPAGGGMGSLLDNVNRWRGQVGLDRLADEKAITSDAVKVGGHDGMLFDFAGPPQADGSRKGLIIAMTRVGGDNWFFKMTGPPDVLAAQRPAFRSFLDSIQFGGGEQ